MTAALLAGSWLLALLATAWGPPVLAPAVTLVAPAVAWLVAGRSRTAVALAVACAGLSMVAMWRWQQAQAAAVRSDSAAHFADTGPLRLYGVLTVDSDERQRHQRLTVRARTIEQNGRRNTISGLVLLRLPLGRTFRAGDVVEADGRLELPANPPGFDYRAYLARMGIMAEMSYPRVVVTDQQAPPLAVQLLLTIRRSAARGLAHALPQPEAALATGMLTGERGAIPPDLTEAFNASGTSHLIAISGFNISILAGAVLAVLSGFIHRRTAALTAALVITGYAAVAGPTASVIRALLMGLLMLWTEQLGRPGSPLIALALAAALMTGHDPAIVNDLGFQLSFGATAGIMVLQSPLRDGVYRLIGGGDDRPRNALRGLAESAMVTTAAMIATLPVMLHAFGRLSLVSLPANLLAGPLFPIVLLTSTISAVLGLGGALPAMAGGLLAWPPLALTIAIARLFSSLPLAMLTLPRLPGWAAIVMAAAIAAVSLLLRRRRTEMSDSSEAATLRFSRPLSGVLALALIVAMDLAAMLRTDSGGGRLTAAFVEAGGTPVVLVTGPAGERVLIDTGPSAAALRGAVDPLLTGPTERIALVLLTRRSATAAGGLADATLRYRPNAVLAPDGEASSPLDALDTPLVPLPPGTSIGLSGGARLEIAPPVETGGRLRITAVLGERRIALTPGADGEVLPVRPAGARPGELAITVRADGAPTYGLREQGPVRVSTDGKTLRLQPAHGPLAPVPATRTDSSAFR